MNTITRHDFHGWKAALRTTDRPRKTMDEHDRITEAIAAGDENKARSAMRSHLLAARRNLPKESPSQGEGT
jgi:DNA-binding GntR family transcriptional regulator